MSGNPISDEELTGRILRIIAETQRKDPQQVTIDSSFEELGIDSMDGVNIVFALENEFDISVPDEEVKSIRSVRGMVTAAIRSRASLASPASSPSFFSSARSCRTRCGGESSLSGGRTSWSIPVCRRRSSNSPRAPAPIPFAFAIAMHSHRMAQTGAHVADSRPLWLRAIASNVVQVGIVFHAIR